jgi:hypothetical protein
LRVFKNRVLRRIFGLKMEDLAGGWRRQHNWEVHDFYKIAWTCSRHVRNENNLPSREGNSYHQDTG